MGFLRLRAGSSTVGPLVQSCNISPNVELPARRRSDPIDTEYYLLFRKYEIIISLQRNNGVGAFAFTIDESL